MIKNDGLMQQPNDTKQAVVRTNVTLQLDHNLAASSRICVSAQTEMPSLRNAAVVVPIPWCFTLENEPS